MKTNLIPLMLFLTLLTCKLSASSDGIIIQEKANSVQSQKNYHGMIMFDPIGFLTLGPSVNIEAALWKSAGINAGVRLHSLGLLQNLLYGKMDLSYTIHTSFRYYIKPKQKIDGFFLGPGVELGRSNYSSGSTYNVRALGGGLGYKWVFGRGFCLTISDYIGVIQSKRIDDIFDDEWTTDMFVFYLLSVHLGFAF